MQVKELLLPFGSLKAFNLVMDKNTGNSKVILSVLSQLVVMSWLHSDQFCGAGSIEGQACQPCMQALWMQQVESTKSECPLRPVLASVCRGMRSVSTRTLD